MSSDSRTINVSNRSLTIDATPSMIGYASTGTGKGSNATEQGMETIRGVMDKRVIDSINTTAQNRKTLFKAPAKPEGYNIEPSEATFCLKVPRSDVGEDKYSAHVMTSLNGLGAEAYEAYPNDEAMAVELLRGQIKPNGFARDTVTYQGGNKKQGTAIQIHGIVTKFASCDSPPGLLAELVIPTPSQFNRSDKKRQPHIPPDKVVLEVRPYNPRTVESQVMTHLRNYFKDADKYKRSMGLKHRTTSAWINFAETLTQSDIIAWGLITSHLMKVGVIAPILFGANPKVRAMSLEATPAVNIPAATPHGDTVMLAILKALGMLHGTQTSGSDISPAINITQEHYMLFAAVRREIGAKVRFDGTTANLEFGHDNATKRNPFKDEKGKPRIHTPGGKLLYLQANNTPATIGALGDALLRNKEFIVGKIVKGAAEGKYIDIST